jgi:hypothetical protein
VREGRAPGAASNNKNASEYPVTVSNSRHKQASRYLMALKLMSFARSCQVDAIRKRRAISNLAGGLGAQSMRDTIPSQADSNLPARTDASMKDLLRWLLAFFRRTISTPSETAIAATTSTSVTTSPPRAYSELPHFPGVVFGSGGIGLNDEAPDNDAAIRASLIYFKHRWPGEVAVIDGPEAFRLKVWTIADDVGVPLQGPRPESENMAVCRPSSPKQG